MRTLTFVFAGLWAAVVGAEETGELVLRAVDIDTGKPVLGVSFAVENGFAEDWAVQVGKVDASGELSIQVRKRPGYYYLVWQKPKNYRVVGFDDAYIDIVPGGTTRYDFKLRKRGDEKDFPPAVALNPDHEVRLPAPRPLERNVHLASTVTDMPGFEGKSVKFWFYPDDQGQVPPELLHQAERILLNGRRVAAAVRDELEYFQKAVPEDRGDISKMRDILIQLGPLREKADQPFYWRFWCRIPGGLPLRQYGYRVGFTELDSWDLQVPFYLQPPR